MIDRLLLIGFLRPIAASAVCRSLSSFEPEIVAERKVDLNRILREHVANRRTDSATWVIYLLMKNNIALEQDSVTAIIRSEDALSIALLTADKQYHSKVMGFINDFEQRTPPSYVRDEYWLVYYQLLLADLHSQDACEAGYYSEFDPLRNEQLSFIDLSAQNTYLPSHNSNVPSSRGGGGSGPYAN